MSLKCMTSNIKLCAPYFTNYTECQRFWVSFSCICLCDYFMSTFKVTFNCDKKKIVIFSFKLWKTCWNINAMYPVTVKAVTDLPLNNTISELLYYMKTMAIFWCLKNRLLVVRFFCQCSYLDECRWFSLCRMSKFVLEKGYCSSKMALLPRLKILQWLNIHPVEKLTPFQHHRGLIKAFPQNSLNITAILYRGVHEGPCSLYQKASASPTANE